MDLLEIDAFHFSINHSNNMECQKESNIAFYVNNEISYQAFLTNHMVKNVPCLIKSLTSNWGGLEWISENKPNFDTLMKNFGDKEIQVPVANCGEQYFNAQKKEDKQLKEYLDYWNSYTESGYSLDYPCLYLKDWHFTRDFPEQNIYRVPKYFASDWLNEYFTSRKDVEDDYRFVYMGPKGSWTPFHADVFTSFSWSVNLCGKKRWVLFPPGQEAHLTDKHGNLVYDIESPSLKDNKTFENADKVDKRFEVIQHYGDAIFVPSGWHHQVWNLEDTISINHNWVNGCNIDKMWFSIREALSLVKREISDCRDMEDWEEHCQVMLNASYGLNYQRFCDFLFYICHVRLKHLKENIELKVFGDWLIGTNHLKFDILQAKTILDQLFADSDFIKLEYFSRIDTDAKNLVKEINLILELE